MLRHLHSRSLAKASIWKTGIVRIVLVEPDTGKKELIRGKNASRNSTRKAASKTLHCGAWNYSFSPFTAFRSAPRSSTWQQNASFFRAKDLCVLKTKEDRDSPNFLQALRANFAEASLSLTLPVLPWTCSARHGAETAKHPIATSCKLQDLF